MKIISIKFLNLNSLKGTHEIRFDEPPFTESGLFAITGPTGAGKTTILDAITVGLYGRVHRHDRETSESMTRFTGESFAEVEFEVNKKLYRSKWSIRRSRNKADGALQTAKMELADAITGDIMVAHPLVAVQNKIIEICGLDYSQFLRSVMLSQGDFTRFLKASENDRSELLEKITDTGIYSQISTYVFEKAKEKKAFLDALRARMNDVILLSEEEKNAITDSLQQQKEEEAKHKQIRQDTDTKIGWLQKIKDLEDKRQTHREELVQCNQQAKDQEPDFERLCLHNKASVHRLALQAVNEQKKQRKEIERKIAEIEVQLPKLTAEVERGSVQLAEATAVHAKAQTALSEAEPLLEAVTIKDTEIEAANKHLNETTKAVNTLRKEADEAERLKVARQRQVDQCQAKMNDVEKWLQEHQEESELEKDLPVYLQIKKEQTAIDEAIVKLEKELTKTAAQQKEEQAGLANSIAKVEGVQKEIAAAQAQQEVITKKLEETTGEQTVELIEAQTNALPALIAICKDQLRLSGEYQKAIDGRLQTTEQLEDLKKRYQDESDQLKQLQIDKEQAEGILNDLQQLVELQIRVQKYDEAREELEPRKPCPLCGSLHHPYVENYYKSHVNESVQKRDIHKKSLETLLKKQAETGLLVNTLSDRITTYHNALTQFDTAIKDTKNTFDENNAKLPKPLDIKDSRVISAIIANKEKEFKKLQEQLSLIRGLRQQLAEQEKQVNSKQQELAKFESLVLQISERLKGLQRDITRLQENRENLSNDKERIVATAAQLLSSYNITYDAGKSVNHEANLKERLELYNTYLKNLQQCKIDIGRLEAEANNAKTVQLDKLTKLREQELILKSEQESLQEMAKNRREIFGEKDPSKERRNLNEILQQSKNNSEKLQSELHQKQQELKVDEGKNKEWIGELQVVSEQYTSLHRKLVGILTAEGIASIEALEVMFISVEDEQRIAHLKQQIEQRITATTGVLKNIEEEYNRELEKNLTTEGEEVLMAIRAEQEQLISVLNQRIGGLQQKLEADEELTLKHKEVAAQVEEQQKECSRWDKISQLIGSADGKKFSKFAQGLTLARLTELANRHLKKLSDRYRISKSAEKDLELQIIDAYQADVVRPMTTLSGGESFLVSLSLALGLSDLAGSKTQINSLFIDEGFGTLDADTLDVAISALENLQASGKMIGIISHVEALKDRIGTQIEVSKQPGGYSKIKVKSYGKEYV